MTVRLQEEIKSVNFCYKKQLNICLPYLATEVTLKWFKLHQAMNSFMEFQIAEGEKFLNKYFVR